MHPPPHQRAHVPRKSGPPCVSPTSCLVSTMVPPEQSGWNLEGSEACVQAVVQQGHQANRAYDKGAVVAHEPQQPLNHLDLADSGLSGTVTLPSIINLLRRRSWVLGDNLWRSQDAGL